MKKNEYFIFFADIPPKVDEKSLILFKDAGFNTYLMTEDHINYDDDNEFYKNTLHLIDDLGLKTLIRGYNDNNPNPTYYDKFKSLDFHDFKNIIGFYIVDEPTCKLFDGIKKICVPYYNLNYTDYIWHINLLPSYTSDNALKPNDTKTGEKPFEYYINTYKTEILNNINGQKTIGFDHYPLFFKDGTNYLSDTWLYDLTITAIGARESGARLACCVQSFSDPGWRMLKSKDEIRFQLYTQLAFGCEIFEFYHYCPLSTFPNARPLTINGEKTEMYDFCKLAISEIKLYENLFKNYKWNGIFTNYGKSKNKSAEYLHIKDGLISEYPIKWVNEKNPAFEKIKQKTLSKLNKIVVDSSYDVIVGEFINDKGKNAYLIVNFTDPALKIPNNISFKSNFDFSIYYNGNNISQTKSYDKTLYQGDALFIVEN